jgi:threo-3-hydroxy-L-aspartate ammonia-lyase
LNISKKKGQEGRKMDRWVRPTTIIDSYKLKQALGIEVIIASETLQTTGSFKFRAASNLVSHVRNKHIMTASSGNFGQALACACAMTGKKCTVVMPATSAETKIIAVRGFGAEVVLIDTTSQSRGQAVNELALKYPDAYIASPYDDPWVIDGNASLGREVAQLRPRPTVVIVPIGGGGLCAGIIQGLKDSGCAAEVIGAEPLLANDAAQSLRAGKIIAHDTEPQTIADGVRTLSLGRQNWAVMKDHMRTVIEVPEDGIRRAVRIFYDLVNLKVEPTGALSLAALLEMKDSFRGELVCCVVSGGNVDPAVYQTLIGA